MKKRFAARQTGYPKALELTKVEKDLPLNERRRADGRPMDPCINYFSRALYLTVLLCVGYALYLLIANMGPDGPGGRNLPGGRPHQARDAWREERKKEGKRKPRGPPRGK
uniref:Uncharacterized protein n=1 Tax=Florenciella parvula TaxID=236787 RepID=A0A7S2FLP3_9STRA|mmetsp:Transcript_17986/g.37632  ORF Transcript_17986/g.37632 Transcript_17986/m.37632 type:complete len:110 (+) Transcript_17986:278-607(+)